jgi:hypothetical protein
MINAGLIAKPMLSRFWSMAAALCWMYMMSIWRSCFGRVVVCSRKWALPDYTGNSSTRGRKREAWRKRELAESAEDGVSGGCSVLDETLWQMNECGRKQRSRILKGKQNLRQPRSKHELIAQACTFTMPPQLPPGSLTCAPIRSDVSTFSQSVVVGQYIFTSSLARL